MAASSSPIDLPPAHIERGMAYLRNLNNRLDNRSNYLTQPDIPLPENLAANDNFSSTDSSSSSHSSLTTTRSHLSSITTQSTQSDRALETSFGMPNHPDYTTQEFFQAVRDTARKVTWKHLNHILKCLGLKFVALPWVVPTYRDIITLGNCSITGNLHGYHEDSKCIRCSVQLCQVSLVLFLPSKI